MNASSVWNVLKWVLAVLAAGFIGQFGRVLAVRLIERRRKRNASPYTEPSSEIPAPSPEHSLKQEQLRALQKVEKKRAKADLKKAKKEAKD